MGKGFRPGWVALVVFACGGTVGGRGGQGERCPAMDPSKSEGPVTCATKGLVCTYGDRPTSCGRTFATCNGAGFELRITVCRVTPPCPTEPPANGSACSVDCGAPGFDCTSGSCTYPRGVFCACSTSPPGWHCTEPLADPGCPDFMPNLGASCSAEGASCDYDHCQDGLAMSCMGGVWKEDSLPCDL